MGSTTTPSHTQQTQKVKLPEWVNQASRENYREAKDIANDPYKKNPHEQVLGMNEREMGAGGILDAGMAVTGQNLGVGSGAAADASGFQSTQVADPREVADVQAKGFLDRDINAYMNPYTQSVIDPTLDNMRREITQGTTRIGDQAFGSGSFGGSRHAVQEAVYGAEGARAMGATEAGLRSSAFTDAAGRITTDNASALQAALANQGKDTTANAQRIAVGQGNQSADTAAAGIRLGGGQLATQTAQTAADTAGRNAIISSQLGSQERAVAQSQQDLKAQQWDDKHGGHETEMLNLRLAALGMSPYGQTTSTNGTSTPSTTSNPLMQGMGAAASILPLLFSDRRVKKNIKKLGKLPGSDLNTYEFQYKKGFMGRDMPKVKGLMADDVKKKVPGAVHRIGGPKGVDAVDYVEALSVGSKPRDGRDDKGKVRGVYMPRVKRGGVGVGSKLKLKFG